LEFKIKSGLVLYISVKTYIYSTFISRVRRNQNEWYFSRIDWIERLPYWHCWL